MKLIFAGLAVFTLSYLTFSAPAGEAAANTRCPIMTEDEVEEEHTVELGGIKVALCCGKCERLWKQSEASQKYYAKAALELGLLPQLKGKEAGLGLDKITLLPQRFCPVHTKTLITPDSPSVEYNGQKVWFFNARARDEWNKDPEAMAKKAVEAGLLPQLAGK